MGRLVVVGISKGHLSLSIRAQVIDNAFLAHLRQAAGQAMCQGNGQGHKLGSFIRGIAEHQPLVTSTSGIVFSVIILIMSTSLRRVIHASTDFLGLLADGDIHATGIAVKAHLGRSKADGLESIAN